jgi:hypothetical protein
MDNLGADELSPALETLIDDYGLLAVMMSAAEICRLKAAHIRENWQDKELASRWVKAARKLEGMESVLAAVRNTPVRPPTPVVPVVDVPID